MTDSACACPKPSHRNERRSGRVRAADARYSPPDFAIASEPLESEACARRHRTRRSRGSARAPRGSAARALWGTSTRAPPPPEVGRRPFAYSAVEAVALLSTTFRYGRSPRSRMMYSERLAWGCRDGEADGLVDGHEQVHHQKRHRSRVEDRGCETAEHVRARHVSEESGLRPRCSWETSSNLILFLSTSNRKSSRLLSNPDLDLFFESESCSMRSSMWDMGVLGSASGREMPFSGSGPPVGRAHGSH